MKKSGVNESTQQTFVVTAIFVTQMTVTAGTESRALELAEMELAAKGATMRDLSNWHAHRVEA